MHNLEQFKKHLITAGRRKDTVDSYVRVVRRFLQHVGTDRARKSGPALHVGRF
jgi:hypothetical protein